MARLTRGGGFIVSGWGGWALGSPPASGIQIEDVVPVHQHEAATTIVEDLVAALLDSLLVKRDQDFVFSHLVEIREQL
jgi:hypothetical protein